MEDSTKSQYYNDLSDKNLRDASEMFGSAGYKVVNNLLIQAIEEKTDEMMGVSLDDASALRKMALLRGYIMGLKAFLYISDEFKAESEERKAEVAK